MATDVDICNLALSRVRAGSIGSLTENSPQAVQCNILYSMTRDHLLTMNAWGFARTTRALSDTGGSPDEWLYEYDYPNDCLRIHYVLPYRGANNLPTDPAIVPLRIEYEAVPYEVATGTGGSRVVWTDQQEAYIEYTKAVTDTQLFDPLFVQALSWLLAIDLAIPLGGDSGQRYRESAERAFKQLISEAAAHSANEKERGRQRIPRQIQARYGGGGYYEELYLYRRN